MPSRKNSPPDLYPHPLPPTAERSRGNYIILQVICYSTYYYACIGYNTGIYVSFMYYLPYILPTIWIQPWMI